jgi:PTS system nitrogen regulatory IIA component
MKITDFLKEDLIVAELDARDKSAVISELATKIADRFQGLSAKELERVLWERERLESTGIADGVAIPHGKMASLTELLAAFGRSKAGVDFQAIDGKASHIFFVLVAPENSVGLHLKALARISRLCKDAGFRARLLQAGSAADIYRVIVEEDARY